MNFTVAELVKQVASGREINEFVVTKFDDWNTEKHVYSLTVRFTDKGRSDVYTKRLELKKYSFMETVLNDITLINPGRMSMIAYTDTTKAI